MRKKLVQCLVGSWNYNLQTPESDKDWKLFTLPSFEDLYKGKMFAEQTVTSTEDIDSHDIRKLPELLWKANVNFLEVLHSTNIRYFVTVPELLEIFKRADEWSSMNLPYLFRACIGMHMEKMGKLDKATEGTQHLVDQHGWNTKEGLHAYRVLDFLQRFAVFGFKDFEQAMTYGDNARKYMLDFKNGVLTKAEFIYITQQKKQEVEWLYKDLYLGQSPREDLKQELDHLVMNLVKKNLDLS